jgi:ergothioneine biosynthesis protein EgtB
MPVTTKPTMKTANPLAEYSPDRKQNRSERENLKKHYKKIRSFTESLTESLETEDFVIQAMENASPAKWHLAHTTWFFEVFVLKHALKEFESMHPQYDYIFNSYYVQTSDPHCRDKRGNLSRPTVKQVFEYRKYVDEHMLSLIDSMTDTEFDEWASVVEVGIHHEQQHQELLLTDLKYMFAQNPLYPIYQETDRPQLKDLPAVNWVHFDEGVYEIGHLGDEFGYDNEFPNHKTYIHDFAIADRLVTNGEYLEFLEDGGYKDPKWWLDEGFAAVENNEWDRPLYWVERNGEWYHFTLSGLEKIDVNEPVTHVSYFEADAYARWKGCRLPTEHEWEVASKKESLKGNFVESKHHHPACFSKNSRGKKIHQMFGDVWQWTQSSYAPYPGYKPFPGALGEYNGKFMVNQYVLRGGSCATSRSHIRKTYRNFFHTGARWQFSGIRLAKTIR